MDFLRRFKLAGLSLLPWTIGVAATAELPLISKGLVVQFDASRGVVTGTGRPAKDGEVMLRWADLATAVQGDNVAIHNASTQAPGPYYLGSVPEINGWPAVDFRNDDLLTAQATFQTSAVSWFIIFRTDFSGDDMLFEIGDEISAGVSPANQGSVLATGRRRTDGSDLRVSATIANRGLAARKSEFFLQSAVRSTNGSILNRLIDRNGAVLSATASGVNTNRTETVLKIGAGEYPFAELFTGQIAELLIYDGAVSASERSLVENYLFQKYFGPEDSDRDQLPDAWEMARFSTLAYDGNDDPDGDLLPNRAEFAAGSDPANRDTDSDGLDDAREVAAGTSPLAADSDLDGFADPLELLARSDPRNAGSRPPAIFSGLVIHSDMESPEQARSLIRNLAGPGGGVWSGAVPLLGVEGIAGRGTGLPGAPARSAIDYGLVHLSPSGASFSIAFKAGATGGIQTIASQGNRDFTRPGWSLSLVDGSLVLRATGSDRRVVRTLRHPGPLAAGGWHVAGFTLGPDGTFIPYLDGSTAGWDSGSMVVPGFGMTSESPLLLGNSDSGDHAFAGILDEFSVWQRVLTPLEMLTRHQNALAGNGIAGNAGGDGGEFSVQPRDEFVFVGQAFTLRANAGSVPIQWEKNGAKLVGKTAPAFTVEGARAEDAGDYRVVASNASFSQPSAEARVRVEELRSGQVMKTRGGATRSGEFVATVIAVEGDGMAAGIPDFRPGGAGARGVVRFLRRSAADPDQWETVQVIDPPTQAGTRFGRALVLEGDTLVISMNGNATGQNRSDMVFVYGRTSAETPWQLRQEVLNPLAQENNSFGNSLSLDGDTLVVGAIGAKKAFVFARTSGTWSLLKTLNPPNPLRNEISFAEGVALAGDTLVVSESISTDPADDTSGAVHLYRRDQGGTGQWGHFQKLRAPVPASGDRFGSRLAFDGQTLAILNSSNRRIEIHGFDPLSRMATWRSSIVKPTVAGVSEPMQSRYAFEMLLQGDLLLVSDPHDREFGLDAGAVHLFRRDPGSSDKWTQLRKIAGTDVAAGSQFGTAIAIQGNEIFASGSDDPPIRFPVGAIYGFRFTRSVVPGIVTAPVTLADSGEPYRYEVRCQVAAGSAPQIVLAGSPPPWLTLQDSGNGHAVLSGTPPAGTTGKWPVRLEVREAWSVPAHQEFLLMVQPGNLGPVAYHDQVELMTDEDMPVTESLARLFADGEDALHELEFEISPPLPAGLIAGISVAAETSRLTVTPAVHENGQGSFTVRAVDRGGLASDTSIRVTVRAINDPPESSPIPDITAGPEGAPLAVDLSPAFGDPDLSREGDRLTYSITANPSPELFPLLSIDPATGVLTVEIAPFLDGEAEIRVRATDQAGESAVEPVRLRVPPIPEPDLNLSASLRLNRQTGLYEHVVTVTNRALREIAGFDLTVTGLPAGVSLHNGSGGNGPAWTVQHRQVLAVGAAVTLVIEYHVPVRGTLVEPQVSVARVTRPESDPAAGEPGLAVDRCELLADGLLIEFTSTPGSTYQIQYSDDASAWKASPVLVRAAGNRVQWIDRGPPRTDTPPSSKISRFYRVLEVEADAGDLVPTEP